MCSFRDAYETLVSGLANANASKISDSDVIVVAISRDSTASHAKFRAKYSLPFRLLSDPNGEVHRAYRTLILAGLISSRTTFLIDPEGVIVHVYRADLQFAGHAKALADAIAVQREVRKTRQSEPSDGGQLKSTIREIPHF
jgi:peroxiredoxin Q/BCP